MPSPTIVLVHGAFGDASSWRPVYDRLVADGHTVLAPPNPLRGIPYDASFTASIIDQLEGPVVLVGHSYGGAVITVAGGSDKVAGARVRRRRRARRGRVGQRPPATGPVARDGPARAPRAVGRPQRRAG